MVLVIWVENLFPQVFHRYTQASVSCYLQQTDIQASLEPKIAEDQQIKPHIWNSESTEFEKTVMHESNRTGSSLTEDLSGVWYSWLSRFLPRAAPICPDWIPKLLWGPGREELVSKYKGDRAPTHRCVLEQNEWSIKKMVQHRKMTTFWMMLKQHSFVVALHTWSERVAEIWCNNSNVPVNKPQTQYYLKTVSKVEDNQH